MDIFFSIEENYLTKLNQYNRIYLFYIESNDNFCYTIYCNLFIYKLLKYDTNVRNIVNNVVTKENILFILMNSLTKFQKMKSNLSEKTQFKLILKLILSKLFYLIQNEEFVIDISIFDILSISPDYACLFFINLRDFLLKIKLFPGKLIGNLFKIINEDKDKRYLGFFMEYIITYFIEKYKEISKYTERRINTLNFLEDEIKIPEKSVFLAELYSSIIKNFIEIFKNEEKIYQSLIQSFGDMKDLNGKQNYKELELEKVDQELLKAKRIRSKSKSTKRENLIKNLVEPNKVVKNKQDYSTSRWKKNSRMLKSIDAMEIPLKELINISLTRNLRSSSKKFSDWRKLERPKSTDSK